MERGRIVILSGPSGVGKDTVIDVWKAQDPRVKRVVAYTTRAPRPGEQDGIDYHFVSRERFFEHVDHGDFLEYKEVHGNFYATPLRDMEKMLEDGLIAILKIDVQGALLTMKLRPDALSIFILPPSDEELERRLTGRGTEDPEVVAKRLHNAREEIKLSEQYQHRVINDEIESCVHHIAKLVG